MDVAPRKQKNCEMRLLGGFFALQGVTIRTKQKNSNEKETKKANK